MMSSYPSRESDVRQAKYAFCQTAQSITTGDRWSSSNGASWGAIFTGAATAATLSLILLILGTGLGLSAVSLWASKTISTQAFGVSPIIWTTVTQLLASGIGGSLAGRLRTKWVQLLTTKFIFVTPPTDSLHGPLQSYCALNHIAGVLQIQTGQLVSQISDLTPFKRPFGQPLLCHFVIAFIAFVLPLKLSIDASSHLS